MDRTAEVLEALDARAKETSLQDLKRRGKSRVKVIRPSEIAGMVQEAVERALAGSGYVPPDEVEKLVRDGQDEFKTLLAERESDLRNQENVTTELTMATEKLEALESRNQAEGERLTQLEDELRLAESARAEMEQQLEVTRSGADDLQTEIDRLTGELEELKTTPAPGGAEGFNTELMMKLMSEIAELKAGNVAPAAAASAGDDGLASKIEQIVGSLDNKIEKLGKKVGITDAVEADTVQLDGIFSDHGQDEVESNINTVEVKKRKGAGIAANLERMKKLRKQGG